MKKIDKIRAIKFQPTFRYPGGEVYGYVEYDIKKVRRTDKPDLWAMLYDKTIELYPFAVIDGGRRVVYENRGRTAQFFITLPLTPWLSVVPMPEGE